MTVLSSLGLLAGVFLLLPKGVVGLLVVLAVARFSPLLGVGLFVGVLLLGRGL